MKTQALEIQLKLIRNESLDYQDRTFLIGFIMFALEFQDYVKGQYDHIRQNREK